MTMNIYGEYFDEAMRGRMTRDKIPAVRRAVVDRGRYALRGYVMPATDGKVYFFYKRRDGRVACSWGPIEISKVIQVGDEVLQ